MGVNVTIRQESDKVKGAVLLFGVGHELIPGFPFEHLSAFQGVGYQLGALGENTAAADGVVSYFGVTHIVVRGKTYGGSVGLQFRYRTAGCQPVQGLGQGGP